MKFTLARVWRSYGDWFVALFLLVTVPLILSPYLYQELPTLRGVAGREWSPDEGTVLSNADRWGRGHVLYRDVFDFKGPIGFVPAALAFAVWSPSLAVGRMSMFVVMGFLALAVYLACARIARKRWVGIVGAASVPFVAWPCWPYAYQDPLGAAFVLAACVTGLHTSRRAMLGVGALLGLSVWTSIAQGAPAVVALGLTLMLRAWVMQSFSELLHVAARILGGLAVVTTPLLSLAAGQGTLGAMLWSVFVFPFKYYQAPINVTTYAFDQPQYANAWGKVSALDGGLAELVSGAAAGLPLVAIGVGILVGLSVLKVWIARLWNGKAPASANTVFRVATIASASAVALPVVFGYTRSDLAHIGFVLPECVVTLCALAGAPELQGTLAQPLRWVRNGALVVLLQVVTAGAWMHARQVATPFPRTDPDTAVRAVLTLDDLSPWTEPGDEILSPIYGGLTFLVTRRENVTRFATLWQDYAGYQWEIAARDVAARRPKVLRALPVHMDRLATYQPQLLRRYRRFGRIYVRVDLLPRAPKAGQ